MRVLLRVAANCLLHRWYVVGFGDVSAWTSVMQRQVVLIGWSCCLWGAARVDVSGVPGWVVRVAVVPRSTWVLICEQLPTLDELEADTDEYQP
jgi:hypothetical protein